MTGGTGPDSYTGIGFGGTSTPGTSVIFFNSAEIKTTIYTQPGPLSTWMFNAGSGSNADAFIGFFYPSLSLATSFANHSIDLSLGPLVELDLNGATSGSASAFIGVQSSSKINLAAGLTLASRDASFSCRKIEIDGFNGRCLYPRFCRNCECQSFILDPRRSFYRSLFFFNSYGVYQCRQ